MNNDHLTDSWHIIPTDDLRKHNTLSDYCPCAPRIEHQLNGHRLIVHNAYDGREFWEQCESEISNEPTRT